jgi:SAM-dependent methyltransferase
MNLLKKQAQLSRGEKILDVGFAQDPNKYLKGEIIGLDVQKVKKPQNYAKTLVVNLNFEKIPYADKYFDTVILGSCIEHVENPSYLLRETNRVLKDKGRLVLTVPHANDWWTTIHNWLLPFVKDQDEGEHLSNWTKLDMIRLIKRNGFGVKKIHGTHLAIPVFHIEIPVGPLYMFGWALIFECDKIGVPSSYILTRESKDHKFIKVKK